MARVSFEGVKRLGIALAWILLFVVVGAGVTIGLANVVPAWGGDAWLLFWNVIYALIGFVVATVVVGRLFAKESWDRLGWHTGGRGGRGLGLYFFRGVGIGALLATLAIGLAFLLDSTSVTLTHDWSRWPSVAALLAVTLLGAALTEELVFRGFPLRRLADAIGPWPAMLVLAIGFALGHLDNPNVTLVAATNIALAAIWLSFAFFSTGGMALAWGLHFGWNAGLALVFDAPVSGYVFRMPAVEYVPGAHPWIDGGPFGPEGGIVGTLAMIAGTLYLVRDRLKQPRAWLAA